MADIRRVTETFAVAPQVEEADFAALKAAGFRHIINNRPDGEAPDQISSHDAEAAAAAAGLTYVHAPFVGQPTDEAIEAVFEAFDSGEPTLAYCRSGTRCINAWAIAAAASGKLRADDIVSKAATAGYNLEPLKEFLRNLSPS